MKAEERPVYRWDTSGLTDLTPCPFCGESDPEKLELEIIYDVEGAYASYHCQTCEADGPRYRWNTKVGGRPANEEAARRWNERKP